MKFWFSNRIRFRVENGVQEPCFYRSGGLWCRWGIINDYVDQFGSKLMRQKSVNFRCGKNNLLPSYVNRFDITFDRCARVLRWILRVLFNRWDRELLKPWSNESLRKLRTSSSRCRVSWEMFITWNSSWRIPWCHEKCLSPEIPFGEFPSVTRNVYHLKFLLENSLVSWEMFINWNSFWRIP